jgi:mycothiol system anti-sigma-R factor
MRCEEVDRWIGPLLDGELDARNTTDVQAHLAGCPVCQRSYEAQQAVSTNIRSLDLAYKAPQSLRRRIFSAIEAEAALAPDSSGSSVASAGAVATRAPRRSTAWLLWAGWPVAVAASGLLATVLLQQRSLEANAVVAAHVRSLMVDHLNDVVSTDRHTVKPWFAGKLDFSPPVPDLSAEGFELIGGRLEYLGREPLAAVIYRKHGHIINVLSSPAGRELAQLPHMERLRGYSLRGWQQSGLDVVAVSDIEPLELAKLEQAYEAAVSPQTATEPSR